MSHRKARPKSDVIFFDPTGRRWIWAGLTAGLTFAAVLAATLWVTMQALTPLWHAAKNESPAYPEQVTAQAAASTTPNIGEGDLTRVDLVSHKDGITYLTDPFSNTVFRQATPAEVKAIGSHTSVIEHYGYLPDNEIVLTFDDGPSSLYTPQILSILEKYHVPATFFVIGDNVLANPSLIKREVHDGDTVGIHTLTHVQFEKHDSVRDREEMVATDRLIRDVAGYNTRIWRIPYTEEATPIGILTAQQLGYQEIDFDLDTHDWQYNGTKPVPIPKLDGNGHVVIMHDSGPDRQQTIKLLPKLIQEAEAQHYKFVTIGALLPSPYQPKLAAASTIDQLSSVGLWFMMLGWHEITSVVMYGLLALTSLLAVVYVVLAFAKHRRNRKQVWPTGKDLPPASVVIPAHNEEETLTATLERLRCSEYPNFEVIVVVNGCSDNTEGIANAFAAEWPQMRVIHSPPGKAHALNEGIKAALHNVVDMLDADTHVLPDTLSKLNRHFGDSRVGGVAGHIKVGNLRGFLPRCQAAEYLQGITIMRLAEGVVVAPGACSAFRKEAILDAGGVTHDTYTEDYDFSVRMRRQGWRIVQDNDAIALTEVPESLPDFLKQRNRWMYGTIQAMWKHRDMLFRPRYGWFGMYTLPYHLFSMVTTILAVPLIYIGAGLSIASGRWGSLVFFSLFAIIVNLLPTLAAVLMMKERAVHLLVVPLASFVMNPLRALTLYVTLLRAIKGQVVSTVWTSPQRNSITAG